MGNELLHGQYTRHKVDGQVQGVGVWFQSCVTRPFTIRVVYIDYFFLTQLVIFLPVTQTGVGRTLTIFHIGVGHTIVVLGADIFQVRFRHLHHCLHPLFVYSVRLVTTYIMADNRDLCRFFLVKVFVRQIGVGVHFSRTVARPFYN